MGKIKVSERLFDFIEVEFQSMVRFHKELEEDRNTKLPDIKRVENREAKEAKRKGVERKKRTSYNARDFALKGKTHLDFNNFVYMCVYLIQSENEERLKRENPFRKDILKWRHEFFSQSNIYASISEFLIERGLQKSKGKQYTANDIKKVITSQFGPKSSNYEVRESFEAFFEHSYKSFLAGKNIAHQ